jgi:hypothetical protein
MDEHELTHELQRFTTRFTDRIAQATEVLEHSPSQRVRDEALRKTLGYISSAIEIATGPYAEIDLLDMLVFVHLCRTVLDKHWIPTLYADEGLELSDAFAKSETEISDIADRALGASRTEDVMSLVDAWLADNPKQVRVEGIRLADFASGAARAAAERMLEAKGREARATCESAREVRCTRCSAPRDRRVHTADNAPSPLTSRRLRHHLTATTASTAIDIAAIIVWLTSCASRESPSAIHATANALLIASETPK